MMRKFLMTTCFVTLILILLLVNPAANVLSINGGGNSNNITTFTNNNSNIDISNLVYDIDSSPFNVSYADWTQKWWQWAYSIPQNINPAYDDTGKFCKEGQKKPVWFFPGTYQHSVTRYCEIPYGVGILFPILNSECSFAEYPQMKTEEELSICAQKIQDKTVPSFATLNGLEIQNLANYRIQSELFNFTLPENNILNLASQTTQAVSDGNWVFLKPLEVGNYELVFEGNIKTTTNNDTNASTDKDEFAGPIGWNYTTTYILTVKK